jgi:hypothetical protein
LNFARFGAFAVDLELVAFIEDKPAGVTIHFRDGKLDKCVLSGKDADAARAFVAKLPDAAALGAEVFGASAPEAQSMQGWPQS